MEPPPGPISAREPPVDESTASEGPNLRAASETRTLAARLEDGLAASDRWLHLLQDAVLVGVAALMLVMGVLVLVNGVGDLLGTVTVRVGDGGAVTVRMESGRAVV